MHGRFAFDHPLLSGLLGDEEIGAPVLGVEAEIAAMLAFETRAGRGGGGRRRHRPGGGRRRSSTALASFSAGHWQALKAGTARDGVVVPELVRQLRRRSASRMREHVHFGATSQDVIDTALVLRAEAGLDLLRRAGSTR